MNTPTSVLSALVLSAVLAACQQQEVRTMTPSNVGSASQSQTNEGLDASRYIITPVDLSQTDDEDMPALLLRDMEALDGLFARTRNAVDVESALKQVELAGINYRTMILRVGRGLDSGEAEVEAAWRANRPALQAAHGELMATAERLEARHPDLASQIGEQFDKFNFGLLATARPVNAEPTRTGGADARDD